MEKLLIDVINENSKVENGDNKIVNMSACRGWSKIEFKVISEEL